MPEGRFKRWHVVGVVGTAAALLLLALLHTPRTRRSAASAAVRVTDLAPSAPSDARAAPVAPRPPSLPASEEHRRADLLTARSIDAIANTIRDHIATWPAYAELANCDPGADQLCRELLSQAIYEAMHVKVLTPASRDKLGLSELNKHDADAIFETVGRVLTESKDGVERASALMLLQAVPSLPLRALPEAAYRNLSERTVAEAQLTLQQPIGGPIPYPEIPRELVKLFTEDRDQRLQDMALTALAYPETQTELLAAVGDTARKHNADWPDWLLSFAQPVGNCGLPCRDTLDAVLDASGDDAAVAEEMLRACPEYERVALARHMARRFEPNALIALATSAGVELPSPR
jgi:hypothetical protein